MGQQQEQQDELSIKTLRAKLYRLYVVFEREVREYIFFHDVYSIMSLISGVLEHQLTRNLSTSYSLAIKALEYYEILNSRFALEHRYSSRGREEKESDSITVHGFQISKSKLRDEIEHIVRSKISSIGYPLLAFTRRALQDNDDDDDDESLKIFETALDLCPSSFSKSVVLSDALKRGGDTNHPMLSRLLTRTEINSSTLLTLRKTDEFEVNHFTICCSRDMTT